MNMSENVRVNQTSKYQIEIFATDPEGPGSNKYERVKQVNELTPYGMLLAGLGECTTIVLHTFAKSHGLDLKEVEIHLGYERNFKDDCEKCDEIDKYEEKISEEVYFYGDLEPSDYDKLNKVAEYCSIRKMLESGVKIETRHK
jgi:uncharacterized OsmC-like protein